MFRYFCLEFSNWSFCLESFATGTKRRLGMPNLRWLSCRADSCQRMPVHFLQKGQFFCIFLSFIGFVVHFGALRRWARLPEMWDNFASDDARKVPDQRWSPESTNQRDTPSKQFNSRTRATKEHFPCKYLVLVFTVMSLFRPLDRW